jgi:hypothetical protein
MFNRGIGGRFVKRLNAEYERDGWWRAIASDRDLFIAIRHNYINVYWKGNSLLKLHLNGDRLVGETHYKYLLRCDKTPPYVCVDDGVVKLPDAPALFLGDLSDMGALKRAAAAYVGDEKDGVHRIVLSNPNVVDVEVAFGPEAEGEVPPSTPRIDFAALRSTSAESVEIVFYEAKLFSNNQLRAKGDTRPPVAKQIDDYTKLLGEHSDEITRSYRKVCGNLIDLNGVRDRYEASLNTMRRLAAEEIDLQVNASVWLAVFGFDIDQREGTVWKEHRKKLKDAVNQRLLLKGNAQDFTRGISALL